MSAAEWQIWLWLCRQPAKTTARRVVIRALDQRIAALAADLAAAKARNS